MDSPDFDCYFGAYPFILFSFFSVLHFLVVVSVRYIKLTHVGFWAHVKIASRIVSYRSNALIRLAYTLCSTHDDVWLNKVSHRWKRNETISLVGHFRWPYGHTDQSLPALGFLLVFCSNHSSKLYRIYGMRHTKVDAECGPNSIT